MASEIRVAFAEEPQLQDALFVGCSRFGNPGVPFQKDGAGTRVMRTPTLLIGSTIARARALLRNDVRVNPTECSRYSAAVASRYGTSCPALQSGCGTRVPVL